MRKHPLGVGVSAVAVIAAVAWLAIGFFGVHTLFIDDVVDEAAPVFDTDVADIGAVAADVRRPGEAEAGPSAAPEVVEPPATDPAATETPADTIEPTAPTDATDAEPLGGAPTSETAAAEIVTELTGTFESDAHPTSGTATVLGNGTGQRFLRFEGFETDNGPDLDVYLVNSSTGDVSDYIDLGDLKGNIGDQNYEIPEGVDLSVYDEVRIWCVRFGVGFGTATLMPT
ncbi:MAG: hypothetical protein HKN41_08245 [Ilumatobacter sp.]|nr:hypothetical protein [Ilumatobacter sp.]